MIGVGRRLILLSGIKGVGKSSARWILGLKLILHLFLSHLVSCAGAWCVCVIGADIAAWPYSVSLLCKLISFFWTLRWPPDAGIWVIWHFISGGDDPLCAMGWTLVAQ